MNLPAFCRCCINKPSSCTESTRAARLDEKMLQLSLASGPLTPTLSSILIINYTFLLIHFPPKAGFLFFRCRSIVLQKNILIFRSFIFFFFLRSCLLLSSFSYCIFKNLSPFLFFLPLFFFCFLLFYYLCFFLAKKKFYIYNCFSIFD